MKNSPKKSSERSMSSSTEWIKRRRRNKNISRALCKTWINKTLQLVYLTNNWSRPSTTAFSRHMRQKTSTCNHKHTRSIWRSWKSISLSWSRSKRPGNSGKCTRTASLMISSRSWRTTLTVTAVIWHVRNFYRVARIKNEIFRAEIQLNPITQSFKALHLQLGGVSSCCWTNVLI